MGTNICNSGKGPDVPLNKEILETDEEKAATKYKMDKYIITYFTKNISSPIHMKYASLNYMTQSLNPED